MKFLAMHTKGKEVINVIDILTNNFAPNYIRNEDKSYLLGYSTRKLLLTKIGVLKETDRDSYSMKRIDLAGSLLLELPPIGKEGFRKSDWLHFSKVGLEKTGKNAAFGFLNCINHS